MTEISIRRPDDWHVHLRDGAMLQMALPWTASAFGTSGDPRFFLGTDSAPHLIRDKEMACGCAGIFTAPIALELDSQVFEEEGALDRLEAFASRNGARFYGLPPSAETITLVQSPWQPPKTIAAGDKDRVQVFCPDGMVRWRLLAPTV